MTKIFFKKLTVKEKQFICGGLAIDPFKPNKECFYGTPERKGACDQVIGEVPGSTTP